MQPEGPEQAPSVSPDIEIDNKQAEAAKIERFLGAKDADMLDAIRWANSDDRDERTLAAQVFAEIGTPEALRYEQTLGHDADRKVAQLASGKLKHWGQDNPYGGGKFNRRRSD